MVTVVIPVRDRATLLAVTLRTVREQTAPPGEVIVADDGSGDGSPEVAARAGARVLRRPQGGWGAAGGGGGGGGAGGAAGVRRARATRAWPRRAGTGCCSSTRTTCSCRTRLHASARRWTLPRPRRSRSDARSPRSAARRAGVRRG